MAASLRRRVAVLNSRRLGVVRDRRMIRPAWSDSAGTGPAGQRNLHGRQPASFSHLVVKLVFAAPLSFFSAACVSQHFFTKLVFAAPASFLSPAWTAQVALWAKAPSAKRHNAATMAKVLISISLLSRLALVSFCDRQRVQLDISWPFGLA